MKVKRNWGLLLLFSSLSLAFALSSCTKSAKQAAVGPDGKPLVSAQADPDRIVMETEVHLPKGMQGKVRRTDLLIWDLRDSSGDLLAGNIGAVPAFPYKLVIRAKNLRKGIVESEPLLFNARIVKFGEENRPPAKGQLHVSLGMAGDANAQEVVNPHVDQQKLEKWMKKSSFAPVQAITVGSKVKAELGPIVF